ncbi:YrbL family protein [Marinomonas sp. TI.3.20]|uniref:YrbL family protein n=1 Tax=Marinomonas sp. TI.3.20 TaxID=3121296 RepID=UPI00311DB546
MNLELTPNLFIATGNNRDVYLYPSDDQRCIKIQKIQGDKHNRLEAKFLETHKSSIFPKYYGLVPTNLGDGLVVNLVKDFDGETSKSLVSYIESKTLSKEEALEYIHCVGNECLKNNFIMSDDGLQNILLKKASDGTFEPVFIDGFGPRNDSLRYQLRSLIPPLTRYKTRKQIRGMLRKLNILMERVNAESSSNDQA